MDYKEKTQELAALLKSSEEYLALEQAREQAMDNPTTRAMLSRYHQLQLKAQAMGLSGKRDDALLEQLQRMGEVLLFDPDASAYLLAEYKVNEIMADIVKRLSAAVGFDLSILGE